MAETEEDRRSLGLKRRRVSSELMAILFTVESIHSGPSHDRTGAQGLDSAWQRKNPGSFRADPMPFWGGLKKTVQRHKLKDRRDIGMSNSGLETSQKG